VPPTGEVIKVNNDLYVEELRRPLNALKLEKHVESFGNFVAFTQKEKDDFQRIYAFEMNKLLQS
jgi:endo-1,4-beta-D-glucanase Y